jgi:hypothetical protein
VALGEAASIVAVIIALATFITGVMARRRLVKIDHVKVLELSLREQIEVLKNKHDDCERLRIELDREVKRLRAENMNMMRRLVRLENNYEESE